MVLVRLDAAKYWFRKAAELGNELAQSNLDVLNGTSDDAGDETSGDD